MIKPTLNSIFSNDPSSSLYNLDGFTSYAITADIDWAPDYAVADLLQIFADAGIKLTCYATHKSSLMQDSASLEVGLHPDYTRLSRDNNFFAKLLDLKEIYPDAIGVRSHRNFFGQNTAHMAAQAGLLYDSSVLLWRRPFNQIHRDQWGLYRLTYCWEDGINSDMGLPWTIDQVPITGPGLKIFNLHPIFIYLNCNNDDHRRAIVKDYNDLTKAPEGRLSEQRFSGYGARSFIIDLLKVLKKTNARDYLVKEMVNIAASK
jgi:hypothetical protein